VRPSSLVDKLCPSTVKAFLNVINLIGIFRINRVVCVDILQNGRASPGINFLDDIVTGLSRIQGRVVSFRNCPYYWNFFFVPAGYANELCGGLQL
jgi:hypothetical protein